MSDSNTRALKYWQDRLLRAKSPEEIETCKTKIEGLSGRVEEELPSPTPHAGEEEPAAPAGTNAPARSLEAIEEEIAKFEKINKRQNNPDVAVYLEELYKERDAIQEAIERAEALPPKRFYSEDFGQNLTWDPFKKTTTFDDGAVYTDGELLDMHEAGLSKDDVKAIHAMKLEFGIRLTNIPYEEPPTIKSMRPQQ